MNGLTLSTDNGQRNGQRCHGALHTCTGNNGYGGTVLIDTVPDSDAGARMGADCGQSALAITIL